MMFTSRRSGKRCGVADAICDAVLFDRDGTLIEDVPYNGDSAAGFRRGCACRVVVGDIGADGNRRVGCTLVVRSDSAGDVLLAGPAIRAVRAGSRRVVFLCGGQGRAAAEPLPWIDPQELR